MSRTTRRIAQINSKVSINQVLYDYGYRVHLGGEYQEQQFQCDLHGDGRDGKPSARSYPASNSFYCFACSKTRDIVETVRAKEGIEFMDALAFIETKYKLPSVPWEDDDTPWKDDGLGTNRLVGAALEPPATFISDSAKLVAALKAITEDRLLPMLTVLAYWETLDKLGYQVAEGQIDKTNTQRILIKLYERLMDALRNRTL